MEHPSKFRYCFLPHQWWGHNEEGEVRAFMWVYREAQGGGAWEVGYYLPDRSWFQESMHPTKESAAARVNFLNGGAPG